MSSADEDKAELYHLAHQVRDVRYKQEITEWIKGQGADFSNELDSQISAELALDNRISQILEGE